MSTVLQDFSTKFDKLLESKIAYAKKARNVGVLALGSKIIQDTPKDTGALRGSWRTTLNEPSTVTEERIDEGDNGDVPREELAAQIRKWPETGSLFLTNRQKYAEGVEFDSWSVQRPAGMVRVNIAGRKDFAGLTTGTGRTE